MKDALDKAFQKSILVASAGNNEKAYMTTPIRLTTGTIYPAAYYCVIGVQSN